MICTRCKVDVPRTLKHAGGEQRDMCLTCHHNVGCCAEHGALVAQPAAAPPPSPYHKPIPATCPKCEHRFSVFIDVYRVLHAFAVVDHAIGHAIKKLLCPGQRSGGKAVDQDVAEALWSLQRYQEMRKEEQAP